MTDNKHVSGLGVPQPEAPWRSQAKAAIKKVVPTESFEQIQARETREREERTARLRAEREAQTTPGVDFAPAEPTGLKAQFDNNTAGLGQPYPIKLSKIDPFPDQPRRYFNAESIASLAESISSNGQEVPIKVCKHPTEAGRWVLIDGERRWRAFKLIAEQTGKEPLVLAFIEVIRDAKEHFRKSWIANLLREDVAPLDEAAGLARLREEGETNESLAAMIGKSITYIDNYLKLHSLPDPVKALLHGERPKDRRLTVTAAIEIARSTKNPALRLELAKETLQRDLNLTDTKTLISQRVNRVGGSYEAGEFRRKPSDDYKVFGSFLGVTRSKLDSLLRLDFDQLYLYRDNETAERHYDLQRIAERVRQLQILETKLATLGPNAEEDLLRVRDLIVSFAQMRMKIEAVNAHPSRRN